MSHAKLLSVEVERFKCYEAPTRIDLKPLTILVGRNNSGKSSLIQALLLLKQTLAEPRPDVELQISAGYVQATSLRELTSWSENESGKGPAISLTWSSRVDVTVLLQGLRNPDEATLRKNTDLGWLLDGISKVRELFVSMKLEYAEEGDRRFLAFIELQVFDTARLVRPRQKVRFLRQDDGTWQLRWGPFFARKLQVELDHFLPFLVIDRRSVGPRNHQRSWYNAFQLLFAAPLEDLRALLAGFLYLGAMRDSPPLLYSRTTIPPPEIGASGEFAAQLLRVRQSDLVHYLPPLEGNESGIPAKVLARPLMSAMNDVLKRMGVDVALKVEDVLDVGFKLLFGRASLMHVGRGLSYLFPVVQLGLLADPLRFNGMKDDVPLKDYLAACSGYTHCAFEESEAHLHPKLQSMLAHWLVTQAMSNRRLIVETHSDHLVRRLRSLVARAQPGSFVEKWLLANVSIIEVEQKNGRSEVHKSRLTREGSLERWPADFMDEATDEEHAIYDASLDKMPMPPDTGTPLDIAHVEPTIEPDDTKGNPVEDR